jgi:hypothetical protein
MTAHPNAVAAGASTGPSVFLVWILGYLGVDVSPEVAVVIAGGIAAATLLVGRKGLRGIARTLWRGSDA